MTIWILPALLKELTMKLELSTTLKATIEVGFKLIGFYKFEIMNEICKPDETTLFATWTKVA